MAVSLKLGPALSHFADTIEQQRQRIRLLEEQVAEFSAEAARTDEASPTLTEVFSKSNWNVALSSRSTCDGLLAALAGLRSGGSEALAGRA